MIQSINYLGDNSGQFSGHLWSSLAQKIVCEQDMVSFLALSRFVIWDLDSSGMIFLRSVTVCGSQWPRASISRVVS